MKDQPFSNVVALRIGLAARALPGISPADLIEALQRCLGETLDEAALAKITVTHLKASLGQTYDVDGDEDREALRAQDMPAYKEAVGILWGERDGEVLPAVEAYREGDMPGSIRVAVASNSGAKLDGHFGSCLRFLIYQVSAKDLRLVDARPTVGADASPDKNAFRVGLIKDCRILYLVSIGGPAAAKVIKADIHMIPIADGGAAREILRSLQAVIAGSPPPWMAKILGAGGGERMESQRAMVASER
jgi:nitrogen fixation protein NifX